MVSVKVENDLTKGGSLPLDWLLSSVMDAIKANDPELSDWCDEQIYYLQGKSRTFIFFWMATHLDSTNMVIFSNIVDLSISEIKIARKAILQVQLI